MLAQVRDTDLHLLRVFVAVAECGGLSSAQERLNVAASTISTQITNLETRLGFRLCERGRAGFALTDEGQAVLNAGYKLFTHLGEFLTTVEALKGNLLGTIRIALLDNIAQNPALKLSTALALLKERQPLVSYEIFQLPPDQLKNAVLRREVDVGVAWTAVRLSSLTRVKLFDEQQMIYCGRDHPFFSRAPDDLVLAELEAADWVRRGYRVPRNFPFASPPLSTAVAYHMESMVHLILAGTHIGYLPEHYARQWAEKDQMRMILPKRTTHSVDFYMITRRDAKKERLIAAATEALIEAQAGEAPRDSKP